MLCIYRVCRDLEMVLHGLRLVNRLTVRGPAGNPPRPIPPGEARRLQSCGVDEQQIRALLSDHTRARRREDHAEHGSRIAELLRERLPTGTILRVDARAVARLLGPA